MSVDAKILLKFPYKPLKDQLKLIQFEIGHRFNYNTFSPSKDGEFIYIVDKYCQDGPSILPVKGETLVEIKLAGNFYGPEYPRGDGLTLINLLLFLNFNYPDIEIWYGGDSSSTLAERYTPEKVMNLLYYYFEKGNIEYYNNWIESDQRSLSKPLDVYVCPNCNVSMIKYGYGNYKAYICIGCDFSFELRRGIFKEVK